MLLALVAGPRSTLAQTGPLPSDLQIRLAVQAAPASMRDAATVQGWNAAGAFTTLRTGTNGLICMAPAPEREDFEVSCHHEALEPFFARGRELIAKGITGNDRTQARWDEFTAGSLPIPFGGINYILAGEGFDAATAEIQAPFLRWVIYTPNASPETTGIGIEPGTGSPWLMFPGTPGSHIMIVPPRGG
jgi:hypothetical protein